MPYILDLNSFYIIKCFGFQEILDIINNELICTFEKKPQQ